MVTKTCLHCKNTFQVHLYRKDTAKYCSSSCSAINTVRNNAERRKNMSLARIGINKEKIGNWKGNEVSYAGLHMWLRLNYKKTGKCIQCGSLKKTAWANKTGKYKRDRGDWLELCYSCHYWKDRGNPKKHRYLTTTLRNKRHGK